MRGHLDHQTATWQLMHFTRCGGVDALEGHTLQGGHVEHRFGGHARTLHRSRCLQEDAGFPAARHQAEQRLVRRGHLDHHKVWRTRSHTSPWRSLRLASSRAEARQMSDARALCIRVWRSYGLHSIVEFDVPISPRWRCLVRCLGILGISPCRDGLM